MGVYSSNSILEGAATGDDLMDYEAYEESCAIAMLESDYTPEEVKQFVLSEECEALITEGKLNRKTIMKLNKNDDLSRRRKIAAFQLAREKNDPLWTKLVANRVKERELINKIMDKYGSRAEVVAKKSQRDFQNNRGTSATIKSTIDARRQKEIAAGKAGRV